MKSTAMQALVLLHEEHVRRKYPTLPSRAIPKGNFSDKNTNGLTRCLLAFIKYNGGYAVRVNTQGQYNPKLKKWTRSTTTIGTPDISAIVNGKPISLEVKVGNDKLSEAQIAQGEAITNAGGLYYVATNFEDFYQWWLENFKPHLTK